jgi:rod shape-determining protein MreC
VTPLFKWLIKKENILFFFLTIISFTLIIIDTNNEHRFLRNVQNVFKSVQTGISTGVKYLVHPISRFKDFWAFEQERKAMHSQIIKYQGMEREIISLRNENIRLRSLHAIAPRLEYNYQEAQVLARDPQNFFGTLIINKGARDGIAQNMSVLAYNAKEAVFGLVGRIVEVHEYTSRIMPIYDQNTFIAARLEDKRYEGLFNGLGNPGNYAALNYLSSELRDEINEGDLVITSGLESAASETPEVKSHFPAGLYLGRVRRISTDSHTGNLVLYIKSIINFSGLENVFIITGAKPQAVSEAPHYAEAQIIPGAALTGLQPATGESD